MKKEVSKPLFVVIIALVLVAAGWIGWRFMETPENRGLNEEAIFREAEKKAKANGVDIRTLPQWGALYYKYHPEEKPPAAGAAVAPTMPAPPGGVGMAPGATSPPSAPGGMVPPPPAPGGNG
jgi:hypothetical protein